MSKSSLDNPYDHAISSFGKDVCITPLAKGRFISWDTLFNLFNAQPCNGTLAKAIYDILNAAALIWFDDVQRR